MRTVDCQNILSNAAKDLRDLADRLEGGYSEDVGNGDFESMGLAVNAITNTFNSLRLDLFVNRPLRIMESEIHRLRDKIEELK